MSEERIMQLPPKGKIEWNLNTLMHIVSLGGMVFFGGVAWSSTNTKLTEIDNWRTSFVADFKANDARDNERFKSLEGDVRKVSGQTEALQFRVTSAEQQVSSMSQALKDIQTAVNQQSGDMRVVKEILQRLEAGQKRGG